MRYEAARLRTFLTRALTNLRVPSVDAETVADSIVDAELAGQGGHGMIRVPFLLARLRDGLIVADADMRVVRDLGAAVVLDAGNGLGPVAGIKAIAIGTERAQAHGVGLCAVRRSNHLGAVGYYVDRAARDGMVAVAFTNTPPAMAPPGGKTPLLGTNPIAAAFPAIPTPIVIDLATSQVARGRILKAARSGEPIPLGWAVDREGHDTHDAAEAISGSLLPIGGPKGFALAVMVEALSGVLAGAAVGPGVGGTYIESERESDVGHSFLIIDALAINPDFAGRMTKLGRDIRGVAPVDPSRPVRAPGDRRAHDAGVHAREGIDVADDLVAELESLAATNI